MGAAGHAGSEDFGGGRRDRHSPATEAREPEEAAHARVLADDELAVRGERAQTRPAPGHARFAERGCDRAEPRRELVQSLGSRVRDTGRLLDRVAWAGEDPARFGPEVDLRLGVP